MTKPEAAVVLLPLETCDSQLSVADSPEAVQHVFKRRTYALRACQAALSTWGILILGITVRPLVPVQLLCLAGGTWMVALASAILIARSHVHQRISFCLLAVKNVSSITALSACTAALAWDDEVLARCMVISSMTGAGMLFCLMGAVGNGVLGCVLCYTVWFAFNFIGVAGVLGNDGFSTLQSAAASHAVLAAGVTAAWTAYWLLVDRWYMPRNMAAITAAEVENWRMFLRESESPCCLERLWRGAVGGKEGRGTEENNNEKEMSLA